MIVCFDDISPKEAEKLLRKIIATPLLSKEIEEQYLNFTLTGTCSFFETQEK